MVHANVNINLIVDYVVRIKIGIKINFGASVKTKKNMFVKKILYEILLHVVAKMVNI